MKRLRFRYSIRTLLVLTALVAVACYWLARPHFLARQFAAAIEAGDYAAAAAMCVNEKEMGLLKLLSTRPVERDNDTGLYVSATRFDTSWSDIWRRERIIEVYLVSVQENGIIASLRGHWIATPRGISHVQPDPSGQGRFQEILDRKGSVDHFDEQHIQDIIDQGRASSQQPPGPN